jgi:hypothetical protein
MEIMIDMPAVGACSVTDCAYNSESNCHAKAITIGDGVHPGCDTFLDGGAGHTGLKVTAGVGACKVTGCRHNSELECMADNIEVGMQQHVANCLTYEAR